MTEKDENPFAKHGPWFARKQAAIESLLGPMHTLAGNSVYRYDSATGEGLVDMYYFLEAMRGTGMATMQLLSEVSGDGSRDFELLAFTRQEYIKHDNPMLPFNLTERHLCHLFTILARMSEEVRFDDGDTCEIPSSWDRNASYVLLTDYQSDSRPFIIDGRKARLLLVTEVYRQELDFAMQHGGDVLLGMLRKAGHYPYSDMNRPMLAL